MGGSKLPKNAPVYGLLFGIHSGSQVSILDSAEAIYDLNSPSEYVIFPAEHIEKKNALWTAVFTDYKLICRN